MVGRGDNLLQEPIALLKLVPEEKVGLRELELVEVVLLHQGNAEDVGASEEPAAPALPLVGDGTPFERDLDVKYLLLRDLDCARKEDITGVGGAQGGQCQSSERKVSVQVSLILLS